jgi:arylsulfatase
VLLIIPAFRSSGLYSEFNGLATNNPDKLKELQALFLTEAAKYQVFPLDNTAFVGLLIPKPSATAGVTDFTYTGVNSGMPMSNAPNIIARNYLIG